MRITTRQVAEIAADLSGYSVEDILGRGRTRALAHVRQAAMWAARRLRLDLSLPMIGRAFGKDHTSVLHACRAVDQRRLADDRVRAFTDGLLAACAEWIDQPAASRPPGLMTRSEVMLANATMPAQRFLKAKPTAAPKEPKVRLLINEIEPGRIPQDNWDRALFEPWAERKARLARERAAKALAS